MGDKYIFKYRIPPSTGSNRPLLPRGAVILHAGAIDDEPFIWAKVDPSASSKTRDVAFYTTGSRVPSDHKYISTFIVQNGLGPELHFVGHVFDGGELN